MKTRYEAPAVTSSAPVVAVTSQIGQKVAESFGRGEAVGSLGYSL